MIFSVADFIHANRKLLFRISQFFFYFEYRFSLFEQRQFNWRIPISFWDRIRLYSLYWLSSCARVMYCSLSLFFGFYSHIKITLISNSYWRFLTLILRKIIAIMQSKIFVDFYKNWIRFPNRRMWFSHNGESITSSFIGDDYTFV